MDGEPSVSFLSREQTHDLVTLAERARRRLSDFVGRAVAYDVKAMQLLDEWIDDFLRRSPDPSQEVRLLWTTFLGEMFRRRHDGRWALTDKGLTVVCPTAGNEPRPVQVQRQVDRRVASGMSQSLAYFYDMTRIELKLES